MSELIYKKWADNRNEVLPVGNGRIGGMIYGNPIDDVISLNEETLWSGSPEENVRSYDISVIKEAQKLIKERKYDCADSLLNEKFMRGVRSQTYLPLGKLTFSLCQYRILKTSDYLRKLDLNQGIYSSEAKIIYRDALNTNEYFKIHKKECFVSLADDVLVYHFESDEPESASVFLDIKLLSKTMYGNNCIYAVGRCPSEFDEYNKENSLPDNREKESVPFAVKIGFLTDGKVSTEGRSIILRDMTKATVILAVATGFNGYDKKPVTEGKDYEKICDDTLKIAMSFSYEELKRRHIKKYSEMFSRSEIVIDGENREAMPTDERIQRIRNGEEDTSFVNVLFDYGKYLMISSSQPGGQPSNLQGIWNEDLMAPWNSNYTLNINTQMNYWATEQMNLPECHFPLLKMTKELAERGNNYGLRGWAVAHNTDLWRFNRIATCFVQYGLWDMGGLWLARHIYDHFRYTKDITFLKEYIGVLRGVYDFLQDRFIEDENGKLVLSPSTSPETTYTYNEKICSVTGKAAMDIQMTEDYLNYMEELENILGEDSEKYSKMKEKLCPITVSEDGILLEYGESFAVTEEPHQHLSHLYGIYPGNTIKENEPLYEAARKALDINIEQGGGHNGWANIWAGICYARFKDGINAYKRIQFMINSTIYPNLFNFCPPFQIDGNLGVCALICEMIVQGDSENYTLIPAIPPQWKSGKVRGLKLPGGKTISFSWKNNVVSDVKLS